MRCRSDKIGRRSHGSVNMSQHWRPRRGASSFPSRHLQVQRWSDTWLSFASGTHSKVGRVFAIMRMDLMFDDVSSPSRQWPPPSNVFMRRAQLVKATCWSKIQGTLRLDAVIVKPVADDTSLPWRRADVGLSQWLACPLTRHNYESHMVQKLNTKWTIHVQAMIWIAGVCAIHLLMICWRKK